MIDLFSISPFNVGKKLFKAGLVGISILLMQGCDVNSTDSETNTTQLILPVTAIQSKNTAVHNHYVGSIDAVQNVEIRARVQGYLEEIYVDEGKEVKKGQILFKISSAAYKAELSKTNSDLKTAIAEAKSSELELNRVKILVEKGVVSPTELEVAQAKFDAVNAGISRALSVQSNANLRLSYTDIKSPFNGVIDRIPFKVGSLINEGTLLTTVSDIQSIFVYFNVSEVDYLQYIKHKFENPDHVLHGVKLILADGTTYPYEGIIETMDGQFDETTGSIAFRARFPNPKMMLKHGSTGTILLTNELKSAILVPQKSTFEIQDKSYVFVLDQNNKVYIRSFIPKGRFSDFYIVQSGLNPGEKVVYEGIQKLKEGMTITPIMVSLDTVQNKIRLKP